MEHQELSATSEPPVTTSTPEVLQHATPGQPTTATPSPDATTYTTESPDINPPGSSRRFDSQLEAAQFWDQFGLKVLPLRSDTSEPALDPFIHSDGLSSVEIAEHWNVNPDHRVGAIIANDVLVFKVATNKASRALFDVGKRHDSLPNTAVKAEGATLYFFKCNTGDDGSIHTQFNRGNHPDQIATIRPGTVLALPPAARIVLALIQAEYVRDLTAVSLEFIADVIGYNASLTDLSRPTQDSAVPGEPDRVEHLPVVATIEPDCKVLPVNTDAERSETNQTSTTSQRKDNALDRFSLTGMASAFQLLSFTMVLFLGNLALLGQFTVLFAAPNTGKTLIVLAMLIDAITKGVINPAVLYYINLDDTADGVAEKLRLADEYGFHMLVEGYRDFTVKAFTVALQDMIAKDQARNVIIVLDTVKKFVDVMDKKQVSKFNRLMRNFVLRGGTVIGLAHTNKNPGANGKPIFAGTADIVDDCDRAYVMRTAPNTDDANENEKLVVAENIKSRGGSANDVAFAFSVEEGLGYLELLSSVRVVDGSRIDVLKHAVQVESDAALIDVVLSCIAEGINTKMRLRDALAKQGEITNRRALQLLDKYTGNDPVAHRWNFTVKDRGAKVYVALS